MNKILVLCLIIVWPIIGIAKESYSEYSAEALRWLNNNGIAAQENDNLIFWEASSATYSLTFLTDDELTLLQVESVSPHIRGEDFIYDEEKMLSLVRYIQGELPFVRINVGSVSAGSWGILNNMDYDRIVGYTFRVTIQNLIDSPVMVSKTLPIFITIMDSVNENFEKVLENLR